VQDRRVLMPILEALLQAGKVVKGSDGRLGVYADAEKDGEISTDEVTGCQAAEAARAANPITINSHGTP